MQHWHVDVSENNILQTDRHACYAGNFVGAIRYLVRLIGDDRQFYATESDTMTSQEVFKLEGEYDAMAKEVQDYDGRSEAVDVSVTVNGVEYGYRIMSIDGACEATM
jgi:hypothetical protein